MATNYEVLGRMDELIDGWKATGDSRHIFLSCYRLMSANMLQAIDKEEFHDRDWIHTLLHRFADYYFDALACFDCGENVPLVWQEVHQYTAEKQLHPIQYLIMGVNAHINYDLVLTLFDMLHEEWAGLDEEHQNFRYEDHRKVNEIIAATIDKVQDELLAPADPVMAWIDRAFGRLDEYLLSRLITHWREDVWEYAGQMMAAVDGREREALRLSIEHRVIRRGRVLALGE